MIITFDLETQELIPIDGRLDQLRLSIAGVRADGATNFFTEEDLPALFALLDRATLIIGHNLLHFDFKILQHYAEFDVCGRYGPKTFDMFTILLQRTDRRISLNDLAQRNLSISKLGSGADAPRLFQEGKHTELRAYLAQDLLVTEQLFEHIRLNGKLKYGHIVYREPIEREISIRPP